MKTAKTVGIVGYGAYIPRNRLKVSEISHVWGGGGRRSRRRPSRILMRTPSR